MLRPALEDVTFVPAVDAAVPPLWERYWWYVGRSKLVHHLPVSRDAALRILEVGCGVGYNLAQFAEYFVNANLVGLEQASTALARAEQAVKPHQNRMDLYRSTYNAPLFEVGGSFDVLLFSYEFSNTTTTWQQQLDQAYRDLKPGGFIVVLDFHRMPFRWLRQRLRQKHHQADEQLLPKLQQQFATLSTDVCRAYGGLWEYFFFVGIKPYTDTTA